MRRAAGCKLLVAGTKTDVKIFYFSYLRAAGFKLLAAGTNATAGILNRSYNIV
jgi:hypothetical protein